ncbi:hypothetical protein ACFRDV_43345 [Streptomyces fagopyri]|uniref:hypothetical protein n=1 Tax=Streptomyces fagopyri TaxID=2662397 RepID=UPI003690B71C
MVLTVTAQAGLVGAQVLLQGGMSVNGSWLTRLMLLSPTLLGLYVTWRLFLNPYVSFGQDRFRVNNLFTYYLVPYHSITALEGRTALTLVVSGYGRLPVAALDAAPLTGKAKRDAVARELMRRRAATTPRAGHGFEKRSTIGLPEWLGPVPALALLLMGSLASSFGY